MIGAKQLSPILFRKLLSFIKLNAKTGSMRRQFQAGRRKIAGRTVSRKFIVHQIFAIAMWKTKMLTQLSHAIEFLGWAIVAPDITAIIREPEFIGFRMPVEAHG